MPAAQEPRRHASPDAGRWWALVAISASVLVVGLDLTVLNLALPVLSTQLHASTTDLQWFSASYSLVLAAALLPAGLLGDRVGRKKMLLIALVVFGASSAACAFAGVPGRADRGPRRARPRRCGHLPHVDRRAARAVRPGGAAPGDRGGDGRDVHRLPGRPAAGRLAAGQLLVGLGLPDQRAGRGDRAGRGGVPDAGITRGPGRPDRHSRHRPVQRGPGRGDLRLHQGGRERVDHPAALVTILAGAAVLAGFVAWERRAGRHCSRWSSWSCSARARSPGARS